MRADGTHGGEVDRAGLRRPELAAVGELLDRHAEPLLVGAELVGGHVQDVADRRERGLLDDPAGERVEAAAGGEARGVDRDGEVAEPRRRVVGHEAQAGRDPAGLLLLRAVSGALGAVPARGRDEHRRDQPDHDDERRERQARRMGTAGIYLPGVIGAAAPR